MIDIKYQHRRDTLGRLSFTISFIVILLMGPLIICLESVPVVTGQNSRRGDSPQGLAPSAWPMFGQNPQHTSLSGYSASSITGEIKWEYPLNSSHFCCNAGYPVIGVDGTIYFGSETFLYALSPYGNLKWRFNVTDSISSIPAINANGDIIFSSMNHNMYSVNPQGELVWTYNMGTYTESSPAIGSDGTIYIGTYDNNLIALNSDGILKWSIHIKHGMFVSPAIGHDGTIYMSSLAEINPDGKPDFKGFVQALRPDGTEKWKFSYNPRELLHTPAIGPDGSLYLFDNSSHLISLTSGGKERWILDLNFDSRWLEPEYTPSIGPDGNIYATSRSGQLFSINPNGKILWQTGVYQNPTNPTIGSDGTIYFGQEDGHVWAIDSTGKKAWVIQLNSSFYNQPVIGPDGVLYISGSSMYAFGTPMDKTAPVKISTEDKIKTRANHTYLVDYDTTHFNANTDKLSWNLSSNASWLTLGKIDGVLQGTPTVGDLGKYWVNLTVSNSTKVLDYHNFTLTVIKENHPPQNVVITNPKDGSSCTFADAKNLSLVGTASDEDIGDVLNYTWYENGAVLAYGNSMIHSFAPGTHQITLLVSDGEMGTQTTISFKVINSPGAVGQSFGKPNVLATVLGTSVITIVIIGLAAGTEVGKYGSVLGLAPMYSKTRKEAILDNFTRGKIFQFVWSNPGTYFNLIKKTLNLNTGTVIFHLDKLETEGLIKSHRDGLKKRFYPMDIKAPALLSIFEQILATVRLNSGLSQRALSKALDLSPSTVNEYVHKMEAVGQLRLVKIGNKTKCYLGTEGNP